MQTMLIAQRGTSPKSYTAGTTATTDSNAQEVEHRQGLLPRIQRERYGKSLVTLGLEQLRGAGTGQQGKGLLRARGGLDAGH